MEDQLEHGLLDHDGDYTHARNRLIKATVVCFTFMMVEAVGGYIAGSLAIMTDAAHLLSDVAGFGISLLALYVAKKKGTSRFSYGYKRVEVIGAVLSIGLIWVLTAVLVAEGIQRTRNIVYGTSEEIVEGRLMFIIAVVGLLCNMVILFVLGPNHSHNHSHDHSLDENHEPDNINVRAAYIHAIGDLIQSIGVCIAGGVIWVYPGDEFPMVQLADPIATFFFSILVLFSTIGVLKSSLNVLMEGVPDEVDMLEISTALRSIQGVVQVDHLHIWSLTVGTPILSVHIKVINDSLINTVTLEAQHLTRNRQIFHATFQVNSCLQCDLETRPSHELACYD